MISVTPGYWTNQIELRRIRTEGKEESAIAKSSQIKSFTVTTIALCEVVTTSRIGVVGKSSDALVNVADWISCRGTHHSGCDDVHLPSGRRFPPAYRAVNHDPCGLHVTLARACSDSVVVQLADVPTGWSTEGLVENDAKSRTASGATFDCVKAALMKCGIARELKIEFP